MDHSITQLAKDIELISVKARYYQRYYDYRKHEAHNPKEQSYFLEQVINRDIARLKQLESELSFCREHSELNRNEENHLRNQHLQTLIQEALTLYSNLLLESQSPCEIN